MTAIVLKDRVRETTSTTGTSDFVLGGSASGYQAFSVIGPNNYTYYCCFDNATGDWEVGYGQYTTTAGGTLVRNTVLSNSAATTSKIVFAAGPKDVFITYPAEKAIYEEETGETLINGGPITVWGTGIIATPNSFSSTVGQMFADVDSFSQLYNQNLNGGQYASSDFVAYNDATTTGEEFYVDMGINSSGFDDTVTYPIFPQNSAYVYSAGVDGGTVGQNADLYVGTGTSNSDVVLFVGGLDKPNIAGVLKSATQALVLKDGATALSTDSGEKLQVYGTAKITGATAFGSTVTLNADPSTNLQAATKQYVDASASTSFVVHTAVKAVANTYTGSGATYNNGAGTITNNTNGAFGVVDGVTINVGDRMLFRALTNAYENGVYTLTDAGSAGTPWVVTRATDFDAVGPGEIANNAYFFVSQGTTYKGYSYVLSQTAAITLGVTALPFTEFASQTTYTGGTNIDVTGTTISLTGTVAATNGGTGYASYTAGQMLYADTTTSLAPLGIGAQYQSLLSSGTAPTWGAVPLNQSAAVSGALGATNGGTGQTAYALGDTLYSNATNSITRLAGNTTTTKKFLGQTGTGSGSAAPSWQQPAATDITGLAASATTDTTNASNISSGTLGTSRLSGSYTGITGVGTLAAGTWNGGTIAAAYGGTGQSSYAVGDLLYASTTTALSKLADVAVGNALISGGVGSAPSYGKIGLATHVDGTLPVANGGTGVTASTGSGSVVLSNSPTLVTPALGTPASGTLTNCTFPTLNQNTTGSAATFTSTTQNSQFNSVGVGTAASTTAGEIRATNNITAYYSDERLKTKVGDIQDPLAKIHEIKTMLYHANEVAAALGYDPSIIEVGLSAQSVQRVQPEAVAPAPIDAKYLTVRYERLVPLLVEAIKALDAKVDALTEAIAPCDKP